ncbi:MAG: HAMP domain-containing histidine kinase [Clostridia bacterium]|nr:HAMP domain-containing histidine kinase [Clostridia bacterium]MDE7306573.1 HAMP domain-containing histidine kinase [Clostridia bacterium]
MKKKKITGVSVIGAVMFFIAIAAVVTIAVLIYNLVDGKSGGNEKVIAGVMLAVVAVLALIVTVCDILRRSFMVNKPVEKILAATDRIASGDFSVKLDITHSYRRYDEYDYIMENLNKMAAELARTEVLHNDFISNVSHELKTPLAIIQNYAAALQDDKLSAETRTKYAQTLTSASKKLTALIVNILKLNKLENQQIKPEAERVRLDELLAQAVLGFEEAIDNKNLQLDCDFDEVSLITNAGYLEIVFNNLLSNAVKFTGEGGKISVSLKNYDNKAVVKVTDSGCGIDPKTGRHIFEKFYQGDTSHSQEGNGLGLALVKKVIDLIGGQISVESELEKGSTFTVVLQNAE